MNVKKGKSVYKVTKFGRIPAEWEVGTFSDLAEVIMGQSPLGKTYNKNGNGIPLINGPTEFTNRFPIKIQWTSSPTKVSKRGDILLCVRGSSTGRINISDDKYCIGRGIAAIRAKKIADINFLENELRFEIGRILKLTTGSTFPNIDSNSLRNRLVLIPPLPEQQKIARILSTWDKAIEKTEQLIDQKQKLKKGLMQQLLTGKVRFKEFVKSKKLKKTKIGLFPDDWNLMSLGQVCTKITDGTHDTPVPVKAGIPFLTAIHVKEGLIDFDKCYYLPSSIHNEIYRRCNPEQGDVLLVNIGAGTATAAYVDVNYAFSLKNVALLKPNREILNGKYLEQHQIYNKKRLEKKYLSGNAQPFLSLKQIAQLDILLPSLQEQLKISSILRVNDMEILLINREVTELRKQKKALLQNLLTGKIRLKI